MKGKLNVKEIQNRRLKTGRVSPPKLPPHRATPQPSNESKPGDTPKTKQPDTPWWTETGMRSDNPITAL